MPKMLEHLDVVPPLALTAICRMPAIFGKAAYGLFLNHKFAKDLESTFFTQVIFTYTAQQQIAQSHHHGGEPMSVDTTRYQRFCVKAFIPTLVLLMLLIAACSGKEAMASEEDASTLAPTPQNAVPESIAALDESQAETEPNASRSGYMRMTFKTAKAFVPTHTVRANLNLRPSASLNTTPIAVLKVGSEVEYIKEANGWYYVNTQLHGKGWCSSEYLSPLSPPK